MKVLLIANPISGGRRAADRVRQLVRVLEERGHAVEVYETRAAGDATRRTAEAGSDFDRLLVAGGDGTLNEVLNGLPDPCADPLALFALGTANIVGRELGLPRDPRGMAELVETGRARRIDMGLVDGRRFLSVVSCGFDALVTRQVAESRSGSLGFRGYLGPILRSVRSYRPPRLEVRIDGGPPLGGELAGAFNLRNYGGLFSIADRAAADSGVLDVCVFPRARVPDLLRIAAAGLRGRVSRLPGVVYRTGRRIEIRSAEPAPVEVDGDYWKETPVSIEVVPGGALLLAPAGPGPAPAGAPV